MLSSKEAMSLLREAMPDMIIFCEDLSHRPSDGLGARRLKQGLVAFGIGLGLIAEKYEL